MPPELTLYLITTIVTFITALATPYISVRKLRPEILSITANTAQVNADTSKSLAEASGIWLDKYRETVALLTTQQQTVIDFNLRVGILENNLAQERDMRKWAEEAANQYRVMYDEERKIRIQAEDTVIALRREIADLKFQVGKLTDKVSKLEAAPKIATQPIIPVQEKPL